MDAPAHMNAPVSFAAASADAVLPEGHTIVTPTRRLAHQLRTRHDAACVAAGRRTWRTPDVVPWAEFLRRQFVLDRAAGNTALRWLPESQSRLVWERIVRADAHLAEVLAPAGLGAAAQRAWTLLHRYAIPGAALDADAAVETRAFARWVAQYRRWLERGLWLDPACAAASVGPFAGGQRLRFVGFDRCTPEQLAFVARVRAQGVEVEIEAAVESAALAATRVDCQDFAAELETAARWLARRLEDDPRARVALIVPGLGRERATVRRVLDRVLVPAAAYTAGPAPESSGYELAAARPLAARPVVESALEWLDACVGTATPRALAGLLLGHHALDPLEAHARAELELRLRRDARPVRGLGPLAAAARPHGCAVTAGQLERVVARTRAWGGVRTPSRWAPEFAAALHALGWPGAGADSVEQQTLERWQALLAEFGAGDDVSGAVSARAAVAQLRELAQDTAFEPQEIDASLLVIDPDTAAGMRFDALWICGLDATRWPAPASPDPFLPRDWQVRQGVPGASAELAEAAARRTLLRLAQAAPEVICSVARFEDEAPLLPSAYVAALPVRLEPSLWQGRGAAQTLFETRPALDCVVDATLPAFEPLQALRGGARLLELQAACPFRAAIELRLGGSDLDEVDAGIAPAERGRLVHTVLQGFWQHARDQAALLAMGDAERATRVRELVATALAPLRETADDVRERLLALEARWLEARVLELLAADAQREPFTVVLVEEPRVVEVGGVQVQVQLDRVDRLADGSHAFIDYKTGASAKPSAWMGERPELPQLPLYARTVDPDRVGAVAFGVVRKGATGYAGFVREAGRFAGLKPFDATRAPFREHADWKALLVEWQRRLDALAREHAGGDARLAPDPGRACRGCHLPGLCRSSQARVEALPAVEVLDDA